MPHVEFWDLVLKHIKSYLIRIWSIIFYAIKKILIKSNNQIIIKNKINKLIFIVISLIVVYLYCLNFSIHYYFSHLYTNNSISEYLFYKKEQNLFEYLFNLFIVIQLYTYIVIEKVLIILCEMYNYIIWGNHITFNSKEFLIFNLNIENLYFNTLEVKTSMQQIFIINDLDFTLNYPVFIYFGLLFILTTIFSLLFFSYLGLYGTFVINLISILLFWISMAFYFDLIISKNTLYCINIGKWMYLSNGFKISFDLIIDIVSISFSFLTLTIGVFVYIYTFSYFRYEPLVERLILFLNTFIISMLLLVSSGNFIVMFLGWELIGLTSFFLINFWSTRVGTLKAAFKAFVFNKVSDLFLFFAILLIFNTTYNLDIFSFNSQIYLYENFTIDFFYFSFNLLEVISFFFISCAFIKSAQLGAHIWLPDSMEAPIPASALIHSATLVSAGIFLLLRLTPLFELSSYAFYVIPVIGSLTAFYGGIVASFQSDTKKVLAYSTISHCGFLMVAYSTCNIEYVILYLYVHGFFKAAAFLCIGNINRFNRNVQDFKKMGGFYKYLPFDCLAFFICTINLSGLPLTLGFYAKHLLFIGLNDYFYFYYIVYSSLILGAICGVFYSYRLFYSIFFDIKKGKKSIYIQSNRSNLNSKYYSNTSLASNIAISSLIIVSYITILYLYNLTLNTFYSMSDIKSFSISNAYSYFYTSNLKFNNAISILNWFILILIILIIFLNWRSSYHYTNSLDTLASFILFSFFFFFLAKYIL